ncbi:heme biosynthesis protein HemY [Alkalicaulis satelles]|uniref:Heme biosynthesis protein HemY n=1 Tax=Alkalicaulis satelles TaxID=2609175 RepID=A0A5M6ZC56_9PROT|nr:heme biosynthesis HemY N-terminal domain-containing protein [Alkalicaulis satelles]KAA5802313.1 heme biosynthesis protein HemY [Alkalicaulis satelles]
MIRLILTIALCVVTAVLAVFLTLNPGLVRVEFLGVAAEAPFALAMALLILSTFVLVAAWWVIAKAWGAPDAFRKFRLRRKRDQGFDALERALIASAAGQGALAVRQAARAEALLDRPALSRLLSARAAEADGDLASAQSLYEAMLEDPRTRLVARRGLAAIAEARQDPVGVITHAREAFDTAGPARWAFDSLFSAQVNAARWRDAEATLTEGEKRGHVDKARAARTRAVLLTAEARHIEDADPETAAKLAERAASASPGFAPAADLAARLLSAQRRHRRAAEIVEAAWTRAPHPALARAYGALRKSDTKAKRAERLRELAALNPEHRESRILLAETALDQSNREAARAALASLTAQPPVSARVCVMAARAAQLDGDQNAAQRWMTRAAHAPGEADWSDLDETGAAFPFTDEDWKRMVDAWGREERLIHPRHERFEIAAAAAPEAALLAAPSAPAAAKPGDKPAADSYQPPRAPDDPGVEDETRKD